MSRKRERGRRREAHGVKGETFIITIVSSSLIPPPSLTARMSCLFNTPELPPPTPHSPHPLRPHRYPPLFLSNLSPANPSLPPHDSSTPHLLLSCFYLPSQWAHTAFGGLGRGGEKKRGIERERKRERGECTRPLAVRESAPGWAGFLDTL